MRLIKFYQIGKKLWTSPGALWRALKSKEELMGVVYGENTEYLDALEHALDYLQDRFKILTRIGLKNILWAISIGLLTFWPLLWNWMLPEIRGAIWISMLLVILVSCWIVVNGIFNVRKLGRGNYFKLFSRIKHKPILATPPIAYRETDLKKGLGFRFSLFVLAIAILLNSVIIATPLRPAVVTPIRGGNSYVVPTIKFVCPGTRWEVRPKFYSGDILAVFVAPDEDNIWVIRASYSVRHVDLLKRADNWEAWLKSRLSSMLGNLVSNISVQLSPELDLEERIEAYVETVSDPELLKFIGDALIGQFNEHHEGILLVQGLKMEVAKVSMKEYRKAQQ